MEKDNEFISFSKKEFSKKLEILIDRNKNYGSNFESFGGVVLSVFKGKIPELKTENDINRFAVFLHILDKTTRYAENFSKGGHQDSLDDISNYCNIQSFLDRNEREKNERK